MIKTGEASYIRRSVCDFTLKVFIEGNFDNQH